MQGTIREITATAVNAGHDILAVENERL